MSGLFPVMLKLEGRPCLVIGGGEVATRKVEDLLGCGARIQVVATRASQRLQELAAQGRIVLSLRNFESRDLAGVSLVISATDDEELNRQVAGQCHQANIPVNVVDDPEKCDFYIPAILRRGSLVIAVSTEGKSPLLARRIKEELAGAYGEEYEELLDILGEAREIIKDSVAEIENRKTMFAQLVEGNLLDLIRQEGAERAREWVKSVYRGGRVESSDNSAQHQGEGGTVRRQPGKGLSGT